MMDRSLCATEEKRRSRRVQVNLPVKVRGINTQGERFEEMTHSVDVSSGGALILLKQAVGKGVGLELSLPTPPGMRKAGCSHSVYHTMAKVIRITPGEMNGLSRIAVRFCNSPIKKYYREYP